LTRPVRCCGCGAPVLGEARFCVDCLAQGWDDGHETTETRIPTDDELAAEMELHAEAGQ